MGNFFGKLVTAYALYSLGAPGLIVIYLALSCFLVTATLGWFALIVYLLLLSTIFFYACRAISNWVTRNSIYFRPREEGDGVVSQSSSKVREERHGY